jgi:CBS domain-containing protein
MTATVRDVMTTDVVSVAEQAPFKDVAGLLAFHRIAALPVVDDAGHVVGMVSETDLLLKQELPHAVDGGSLFEGSHRRAERIRAGGRCAGGVMTCPAVTVAPDATVTQAARLMHDHRVKHLPVVDAGGELVGIVSRGDLLRVFLRSDDAILAELHALLVARPDRDSVLVTPRVADGVVRLTGRVRCHSTADAVIRLARELDGVVGVDAAVDWEVDDLYMPYPMLRAMP